MIGTLTQASAATQAVAQIIQAEQAGVPAIWATSVGISGADLLPTWAAAIKTERVVLRTAIVRPWPRHPVALAEEALAIEQLAPGRFRLGICQTGETQAVQTYGASYRKPLTQVRARGHRVTGIDFADEAIRRARVKAAERGLSVEFLVKDALTLGDGGERFASVIDSGLYHVFSDDDRQRYVEGLAVTLEPGSRLFLLCFSDEEPGTEGPRRVSPQELYDVFADGWEVESVQPARVEVNPEFTDVMFSEGGPKAWFAIVRQTG